MRALDTQEKAIVRELIRNPRISDNQLSKQAKIPVKTVNNKRKKLEKEGLLNYFVYLDTGAEGTSTFTARKLFIVLFTAGVTKTSLAAALTKQESVKPHNIKHILEQHIGEHNGHAALIMIIESRIDADITEIFNADFFPELKKTFGEDCIKEVTVVNLTKKMRMLHNYLFDINMSNGKIKTDWQNELIFID